MVAVEFVPTLDDYYQADRQVTLSSPRGALAYWWPAILAALMVSLVAVVVASDPAMGLSAWPLMLVAAVFLFFQFVVLPQGKRWAIGRNLRNNASAGSAQHYEIGPDGFRNYGDGFGVTMTWDKVHRARLSKDFLLLFVSSNFAYFIPRSLLTGSQIAQVMEWAAR